MTKFKSALLCSMLLSALPLCAMAEDAAPQPLDQAAAAPVAPEGYAGQDRWDRRPDPRARTWHAGRAGQPNQPPAPPRHHYFRDHYPMCQGGPGFYGHHHAFGGAPYYIDDYVGDGPDFYQELMDNDKYAVQVKEISDIKDLLFVESEALRSMVNSGKYSTDEVRRQARIVNNLEHQIDDKIKALVDSLKADKSKPLDRYYNNYQ